MNKITNVIAAAVSATVLSMNAAAAESPAPQPAKTAAVKLAAAAPVLKLNAAPGGTRVWTGATSGDWHTPTNWDPEGVPTADDDIVLAAPESGSYTVTASRPINVRSLTIGSEEAAEEKMVIFEADTLGTNVISGNCSVLAGGMMTHTGMKNTETAKLNLLVGGDMTVGAGGLLDVVGKGYSAASGTGGSVASHGGEGPGYYGSGNCYGSIRYPHAWGSGGPSGLSKPGSGAICVRVKGRLTVIGTITAAGLDVSHAGSAGSVWLDVGELLGSGTIAAHGQPGTNLTAGGGRIAIYLRNNDALVSDFAGHVIAYGGRYNSSLSAAGTIYWQTAGQEDGDGTLIVDNNGSAASYSGTMRCTCIGEKVTDAEVGELILLGAAQMRIEEGCELRIRRNLICSNGCFACDAKDKGVLRFVGETDSHISGNLKVANVECSVPGKKFYFGTEAGDSMAIADNGRFSFVGEDANMISFLPEDGIGSWRLSFGAGVNSTFHYAAVSNCAPPASSTSVVVYGGRDLGGNGTKVTFTDFIRPGARITWTGDEDAVWGNTANWDPRREVLDTDVVVISRSAKRSPDLTGLAALTFNSLEIEEGATLTTRGSVVTMTNSLLVAGTLTLDGGALIVERDLSVESKGAIICSGSETVMCRGDVFVAAASGLSAGKSTFLLEGVGSHTVNLGEAALFKMSIGAEAGDYTFGNGFSVGTFRIPQPAAARTLTFTKGTTVTVGDLLVDATVADVASLTLKSSEPGAKWNLVNTRCSRVTGVVVSDSDATGGLSVSAYAPSSEGIADSTSGWVFGGKCCEWRGADKASFGTDGNWSTGKVPGPADTVFIYADTEKSLTAPSTIAVSNLVIGGGAARVTLNANAPVSVGGNVTLLDGGILSLTKPMAVGESVVIEHGGVLTHAGPADADNGDSVDLTVPVMTIDSGGVINVVGKGYSRRNGPGSAGGGGGSHGGKGSAYQGSGDCYGSVCCPTNWGSGTMNAMGVEGGGRVRLRVFGTLTLNGDIEVGNEGHTKENSTSGGGSVWITCGKLSGSGDIDASVDCVNLVGGGGRIAVYLTDPDAHFSDCSVTMHAGSSKGDASSAGGCGTVYLKEAGWKSGQVVIGGDGNKGNGVTQLGIPQSRGGDIYRDTKNFDVIVGTKGHLSLVGDLTVNDLDLADSGASLALNQYTLTIRSSAHKNGRGWVSHTVTSNQVDGVWGKIVWKKPGFVISIR